MVAHKLLCAEGDWQKEKKRLKREIKRLRSEVDLMIELYNNSRQEVQDMVTRLKAQPPPPVPKRGDGRGDDKPVMSEHVESVSQEDEEARRRRYKKGKEKEDHSVEEAGRWKPRNRASHRANPNLTISVPSTTPISPTTPSARYNRGGKARSKVGVHIRDDRHGNEKDRKFAEGIDKCAHKWDSMVRSFFTRLEEIEAGNEGEMYENYVGEEGWDFGVIEWAKTEGIELNDVDKMCWKVRYLEGYKLIREGRRVVLIET